MELSTKDVTLNRLNFLGGSEIAAVMGQSRWCTQYKLWAIKTGKIPAPDLSNNEAVQIGSKLEQFVAELFSEKTGKKVRRAPKVYQHQKYPFLVAHIDRLIEKSDELLEVKTCSAYKLEEWENKIPREYVLQVMFYLGITGKKRGWLCCLIGGQKFDYKVIDFDEELFNLMVEKAVKFWEMVQKDIPPVIVPDDSETLGEVFSEHTDDMIESQELNERVAYVQELKMHRDEINKEIKEIETELKATIQDKAGILTDEYKVTWKNQKGAYVYDKEQMIQDGVFEKYSSQQIHRVLRITKNKGKEKECQTN